MQQLAARVSMILIDVSERTENLLWEIQNVLPKLGPRCILIGHYDKVCRLATNGPHAAPRGLVAAHLGPFSTIEKSWPTPTTTRA